MEMHHSKKLPALTPLQQRIMLAVWKNNSGGTVAELIPLMAEPRPEGRQLATNMRELKNKGYLSSFRVQVKPRYVADINFYSAEVTRGQYLKQQLASVAEITDGLHKNLHFAMIENDLISLQDMYEGVEVLQAKQIREATPEFKRKQEMQRRQMEYEAAQKLKGKNRLKMA